MKSSKACWQPVTKIKEREETWGNKTVNQFKDWYPPKLFWDCLKTEHNLENMTNTIIASLYHVSDYHERCPKTNDIWCQFQKDKIDGTDLYKNKHGLPIGIRKERLPIYHALTKPELLKKCLHGKTQNANESSNGMIWNRIPKATHVGINNLSLGVWHEVYIRCFQDVKYRTRYLYYANLW